MSRSPADRRGNATVWALIGLAGLVVAAVVVRGCDDEPVAADAPPAPAAPVPSARVEAAPPPAPAADPVPAPAPPPNVATLQVRNPCSQPLLMAINFENADKARVSEGFFRIEAGAGITPTTRAGPVYLYGNTIYLYTETLATEPVETGGRQETVAAREVGMKELQLDPPTAVTIELECPGMTSGKP